MNRPRLVRALRIAWSVAWGSVAVLLVALWVRSYSYIDTVICYRGGNWYGIKSEPGHQKATFMYQVGVRDGWFFRSGEPVKDHYFPMTLSWLGSFHCSLTMNEAIAATRVWRIPLNMLITKTPHRIHVPVVVWKWLLCCQILGREPSKLVYSQLPRSCSVRLTAKDSRKCLYSISVSLQQWTSKREFPACAMKKGDHQRRSPPSSSL
jgi:hypothetical protein